MRHGHLPEREIMTGIGPVAVRQPRVRDREAVGGERIRFSPTILPPYARRTKSLEVLIPILYLKGISTGDFAEALGCACSARTPRVVGDHGAAQGGLDEEHACEQTSTRGQTLRLLLGRRDPRQNPSGRRRQCILVIIGATAEGKKELVGVHDGFRESEQSWKELLLELKSRGLTMGPELAIADGALGFWKALRRGVGQTRGAALLGAQDGQRAQLSAEGPAGEGQGAHSMRSGWPRPRRPTRPHLIYSSKHIASKYHKAVECLTKDRDVLLTFYDFPAEHWKHSAHHQPDREHVRNRSSSDNAIERLPLEQDRACHDVQARTIC